MKSLPHLSFLRSFEASARHLSFTAAAEELNFTQAAVSNHVRSLEDYIGRPLFVRHARSLTLTDVGQGYLPSVQRALKEIDTATRSVLTSKRNRALMISCPVSLTEHWMPHVIAGFHALHPQVEVTLNSTVWSDEQENASDITITIENQSDVDPAKVKLWEDRLMLLAAPDYHDVTAASLAQERAIHILGRPEYWQAYCAALGLSLNQPPVGFQCNSTAAALELAAVGVGVAVAPASMAQKLLNREALVSILPTECESPWTYYTSFAEDLSPSALQFKDWLLAQAAEVKL